MRTGLGLQTVVTILLASMIARGGEVPTEPAYKEIESIGSSADTSFGRLSTITMDIDGNLLACDSKKQEIRVIGGDGKTRATWKPGFAPSAIHVCEDGTVYVGGIGALAKLDKTGKVQKTIQAKAAGFPERKASGIAATEKDVFVSFGSPGTLKSRAVIIRFDRELGNPTQIAKDLRGCCQRLDLATRDGVLYAAENARHRVLKYDRDGKVLSTWGARSRTDLAGFGSCCNPMNLYFGSDGTLFTAESGLGRVKRYTRDGKFLGLVGYVGVARFNRASGLAASCSNIAIAVTKDASRVYVQDVKKNLIRVLQRK